MVCLRKKLLSQIEYRRSFKTKTLDGIKTIQRFLLSIFDILCRKYLFGKKYINENLEKCK